MAATVYFAGGEDIDFIANGDSRGYAVAGSFRAAWARCALNVGNSALGGWTNVPPTSYWLSPVFASIASFWLHFQLGIAATAGGTSSNFVALGLASPDGVWRLLLRGTGTAGQWKLSTRNAAGTITDVATSSSGMTPANAVTQFDIFVDFAAGLSLYVNGSSVASLAFNGDLRTDAATQLNRLFLGWGGAGTVGQYAWSEIIISDTDTRSMGLFTLAPQAAGHAQQWAGSASDVNETTLNDATAITDNQNGDLAEFTCPTALPGGIWNVEAIVQSVRLSIGTSGPQHFDFVTRPATGSSDYSSPDVAGSGALADYSYVWGQNPGTAADWALADIAAGFNLGIKAVT